MNNNPTNNRTGLWNKSSKSGNNFLGGNLKIDGKEYSIRIFKNERKEKPSQPDYTMFYDLKEPKENNENTATKVEQEDNTVKLTDEDYDNLLKGNEIDEDELNLPF